MSKHFGLRKVDIITCDNLSVKWPTTASQLTIVEWFITKFKLEKADIRDALIHAAISGRHETIKWLVEYFDLTKKDVAIWDDAFRQATRFCHVGILEWMAETFNMEKTDPIVREVYEHAGVNSWFREKFGYS